MKKIKIFDTFSGVGGFHLSLEKAIGKENVELIGFSEIDKFAKQTYLKNFPGSIDLGDITKINFHELPNFDILTGGFPCQDISIAGKQDLTKGRSILVEYLLKILEIKQPQYFLFENVKALMSAKFKDFREDIFAKINQAGYFFKIQVLNTKEHGIPQNRERIFIIGFKNIEENNKFKFPDKEELKIFLKDIMEEEVEDKYYLSDKFLKFLESHKEKHESKGNGFGFKLKNGEDYANTLRANASLCPTDNIIQINNPRHSNNRVYSPEGVSPTLNTMQGGNRQPKIIIPEPNKKGYAIAEIGDSINLEQLNSKTRRGRVGKGVAQTLNTSCNQGTLEVKNELKIRKLTPVECERLQGFPDNWTAGVSDSQRYKQIGNAISVNVVEKIFKSLFK